MADELQPAASLLPDLRCFVLVVGNARSGSTLLGAALDGHPRAIVSNEAGDSMSLWRGLTRDEVLARIVHRAGINHGKSRASADYLYQIGPPPAEKQGVLVAGDKTWNPTLLLLHGNPELLASLEDRLAVPVRLVYAIRDPFDVIATMHRRSTVPVRDRIRWYFMHCEAAEALRERLPRERWLESHHVDLLTDRKPNCTGSVISSGCRATPTTSRPSERCCSNGRVAPPRISIGTRPTWPTFWPG
jgi:hypothetical protein